MKAERGSRGTDSLMLVWEGLVVAACPGCCTPETCDSDSVFASYHSYNSLLLEVAEFALWVTPAEE